MRTKLLKGKNLRAEFANELGHLFAYLIQQCLDTCEIPTEWSLTKYMILYKKDDLS